MKNYYPKSQIKDNLYTNGDEFVTKNGLVRYEGPYFEVAGENYYTGKDINTNSSEELIRLTPDQTNNISQNYIIPEDEFPKIKLDNFKHDKNSSLPKDLM